MAKATLRDYGTKVGLTVEAFPDAVDPEFFEAWAAYIQTQTAHELFNSAPSPLGQIRAVQGFISSIAPLTFKPTLRRVPSPYNETVAQFKEGLQKYNTELTRFLDRNQWLQTFRLSEVKAEVESSHNRVANSISTTIDCFCVYVPKQQGTKIPSVTGILHQHAPYWFGGKIPPNLIQTNPLSKVLERNGVSHDPYPRVNKLVKHLDLFEPWSQSLGIELARGYGNCLVIHFRIPRQVFFLMRRRKKEVEQQLSKMVVSALE